LLHKPPGHDDGTPAPDAPRQAGAAPAARALLQASAQWAGDSSGLRLLKRHGVALASLVPLEWGASGLLVFSQDWRMVRKLSEDAALIEHELMVDVAGEVSPEALRRLNRPPERGSIKISLNSDSDGSSRLRCAVKGGRPGLLAELCELAGLRITGMKRIRIGRVMLAGLAPGQWRFLPPLERF
jgi:23S rRNA pseudouridine2604 synthase